jgi:hypothetical protein
MVAGPDFVNSYFALVVASALNSEGLLLGVFPLSKLAAERTSASGGALFGLGRKKRCYQCDKG